MWIEQQNKLSREFEFTDFAEAFRFMTLVAAEAETQNHHPWWSNVWNHVRIELSTHDAGGVVTQKDQTLAQAIDQIFDNM